ncbi:hypothetical protein MUY27_09925 [Mucilaginibacter sp. RS28]|uniref:Beta-hexosaminidase bacterial type N-terminal domain-containing protein n=1 Tax=Mucilaginibacter straminoryzae TaxID=2932774 RepID=A0A9X1X2F5_9SPHI|nr:hypothetical protein [Mucilaginibacter straminoryzae]MCJ8210027.1 hypothetical protein [Mucilaginibacter straminoryzae]
MRSLKNYFLILLFIAACAISANAAAITVAINPSTTVKKNSRVSYGIQKLSESLKKHQYSIGSKGTVTINLGLTTDAVFRKQLRVAKLPGKEGFVISRTANRIFIAGADYSGLLYGCLELAERINAKGALPEKISFTDQPEMILRGACVGLQKPLLLPGRGVYEYPYTKENFPWFYDKGLWTRYLDSLADNRMNALYLWNGHPFASLVKVKDYPYAQEVDEATFKKNQEMYDFLTREADKRGIWVIQGFYNIIVSKPFAEHNKLATQDRNRPIVPIIADYTRKSIAAFVEKYPNVGLLITLGEAMEGVGQDDVDWLTKTIIPGVKDGLKALGRTDEPPIVLRAHDTDAPTDMKYALPLYKNLYTMAKYNGEALTTYTPRGPWAQLHQTLSKIGTVHIENVHIMANLEPFRYGSADFIQKCVLAMHNVYGAKGLHIYPQASYWDWPYTADNTNPRELQLERDWIWYKAWARYAWNVHRDREEEKNYWGQKLADRYGCDLSSGKQILEAYEQTGEIAPQLLRRFGITDGNRQTMTLGMLMSQLVNPEKYGLFTLLYNSEGPEGEMLSEYAEKEWKHQSHVGETPVIVIDNVKKYGKKGVEAIDAAASGVKRNKEEFGRLANDMRCYDALANSYAHKAQAALSILRYKYSEDISDLEKADIDMQKSLEYFNQLTRLTENTYLYANSMQTKQRKIPVGGNDGKMKTWVELLPVYQRELSHFRKNIDSLKTAGNTKSTKEVQRFANADVKLLNADFYTLQPGEIAYADTAAQVQGFAKELAGLKAVKLSKAKQVSEGTTVKFSNTKPVKVLVGYYVTKDKGYLQPPQLETDASANDYGQAEAKIANAIAVAGQPAVNIHTYTFKPGTNTLTLGKGACLVLGFVDDMQTIPVYDAGFGANGARDLRWLFN